MNASEFKYVDLVSESYWEIQLDQVSFDGNAYLNKSVKAVIDSGTSLITVPSRIFDNILEIFGGNEDFDCGFVSHIPDIQFSIGGHLYSLPADIFVIEYEEGKCELGLEPVDLSAEGISIILGDVFIRGFYTVFDYANGRVGLSVAQGQNSRIH